MIYYFVACYGPEKAHTYNLKNNSWLPYSPIYRRRYKDLETAKFVAKYARRKNPGKRKYIFVSSGEYEIIERR